jgi:glycosyltransferase involved in cell wall biosynthesis
MERVVLPSVNSKGLDTLSHSFLSLLHAVLFDKADILHFNGVGNALLFPLAKLTSKKIVVTVDGPDWKRPKWGPLAKLALRLSVPLAAYLADEIISDNVFIQDWFKRKYGRVTPYIPYGADLNKPKNQEALAKFGLKPNGYLLFVGMLVPDKGPHVLIDAYKKLQTDLDLVLIGDTPYFKDYASKLKQNRHPRIKFLGYVYGDAYRQLVSHALIYVHPLLADGTSPALLQAMAYGSCIVASDLPETMAVLADAGVSFKAGDADELAQKLQRLLENRELVYQYREKARLRVEEKFSWGKVTDQHEAIYRSLMRR